ncbi:MAG: hypothetical protein ACLQVL_02015 [Terriglobia bacterium]
MTVLRSYPSITYNQARAQLSAILVEQALIQGRIPFHLVFDEHLSQLNSSRYKVLILPNSECLSDEQLAAIHRFAEYGGGVIATEQAGLYDAWRRLRPEPGLDGLVDHQPPAREYEETVTSASTEAGAPIRKEFGRGRVVYFPEISFDGPLPPAEPYFNISRRFWKRPQNWAAILEAVRWAAQGDVHLEVKGPDFLVVNLVEQPESRRRLVHLVNYNAKNVSLIENIDVRCGVPAGQTPRTVRLFTPDAHAPARPDFRVEGPWAVFSLPRLNIYGVAVVSW